MVPTCVSGPRGLSHADGRRGSILSKFLFLPFLEGCARGMSGAEEIGKLKGALRAAARERRAMFFRANGVAVAKKLCEFMPELYLLHNAVIAGYAQRGSELDPLPALSYLAGRGHSLALPVAVAKDQKLEFRAWKPGDPLAPDAIGNSAPLPSSPAVVPSVLFLPVIAFDGQGRWLDSGSDLFGPTIPALRAQDAALRVIGLGFSIQEERAVPFDPGDVMLDGIVTERGVVWFRDKKS
jgi:5-formyltetrahydrofolate cyclo-ligase